MATTVDLGTDISCTEDLNPNFVLVSGTTAVSQALQRRLITPRGRLYRYPDYGYDISREIASESNLEKLRREVDKECLKDERVYEVRATVIHVDSYELAVETGRDIDTMLISITVSSFEGPFSLVLDIADLSREILEVS